MTALNEQHAAVPHVRRQHPRRGKHAEAGHDLSVLGGLSALSLDALSSVAYGPEAMVVALLAGGTAALKWTLPIALVITGRGLGLSRQPPTIAEALATRPTWAAAVDVTGLPRPRSWTRIQGFRGRRHPSPRA